MEHLMLFFGNWSNCDIDLCLTILLYSHCTSLNVAGPDFTSSELELFANTTNIGDTNTSVYALIICIFTRYLILKFTMYSHY